MNLSYALDVESIELRNELDITNEREKSRTFLRIKGELMVPFIKMGLEQFEEENQEFVVEHLFLTLKCTCSIKVEMSRRQLEI